MGDSLPMVDVGTNLAVESLSLGSGHACAVLIGGNLKVRNVHQVESETVDLFGLEGESLENQTRRYSDGDWGRGRGGNLTYRVKQKGQERKMERQPLKRKIVLNYSINSRS